jgi:translation initiation factor 1
MSKKSKKHRSGIVFSTNPDFEYAYDDDDQEVEEAPPATQKLRVFIDRKKRKGKEVTLVTGFAGPDERLKEIGKILKTKCGVGGSVKEGEILIQGNHRDKVVEILKGMGYTQTKKSGG